MYIMLLYIRLSLPPSPAVCKVTLRTTPSPLPIQPFSFEGGRGKGVLNLSPPPPIHYNTSGHRKGWALKLMYIKLPMYLFFLRHFDLMVLMRAYPLLRPLEGVGPEISIFLAQMELASLVAISGPKKCQFQAYPLQWTS
jgi:hypothetical protein